MVGLYNQQHQNKKWELKWWPIKAKLNLESWRKTRDYPQQSVRGKAPGLETETESEAKWKLSSRMMKSTM